MSYWWNALSFCRWFSCFVWILSTQVIIFMWLKETRNFCIRSFVALRTENHELISVQSWRFKIRLFFCYSLLLKHCIWTNSQPIFQTLSSTLCTAVCFNDGIIYWEMQETPIEVKPSIAEGEFSGNQNEPVHPTLENTFWFTGVGVVGL